MRELEASNPESLLSHTAPNNVVEQELRLERRVRARQLSMGAFPAKTFAVSSSTVK